MRLLSLTFSLLASTTAVAEIPRVATDVAPVHGLVSRVMQGVGMPDLVIPPGASPHGYAMRPSEARALSQAQVVFWVGPVLSPWLEEPIETLAADANRITLTELPGMSLLEFREDARFEPHEHDHGDHDGHGDATEKEAHDHEHAKDTAHEGHEDDHGEHKDQAGHDDHGEAHGLDGHIWLDPENAALILQSVAEALSEIDSANAETYRDNAVTGQAEIKAASDALKTQLAPLSDRAFVVFHDSYHYFERHFGVSAVASISLSDESGASASRLGKVRDVVAETGASCVLAELRANEGLIEAVSEKINVVTLDAVGIDIPLGAEYYPSLLRQIGDGLRDCLSDD